MWLIKKKVLLKNSLFLMIGMLVLWGVFLIFIPKPPLLERYTYATAVYDNQYRLLHLGLSMDDKYRLFIPYEKIPSQAIDALLAYEDRSFFYHFGINPLRIVKASLQMLSGSRKQGASTITMQVARLVFHIESNTFKGKLLQILRAMQLELFYSKKEILESYFNLAPYGMNIEGIAAASLIYFKTPVENLTPNQLIALTVIPQNPSKRTPLTKAGKKEIEKAINRLKKDGLPKKMKEQLIDLPLDMFIYKPLYVPHVVQQIKKDKPGSYITTVDLTYQEWLEETIQNYLKEKKKYGIQNAAVLIVNRKEMSVLAKVGSGNFFDTTISGQIDGTKAYRSPGSVMKPFIYAQAIESGLIHPLSQLKDVPRHFAAYTPENYDKRFYGILDATNALIKSRNIPAVDLLSKIGINTFYQLLQKADVKRLKSADYYGLALALGGYELTMENVAQLYAMLGNKGIFKKLRFKTTDLQTDGIRLLSPEASFLTLEMLRQNPPADKSQPYAAVQTPSYPVYWKTGTSFGYRDAWTAGLVGDYVVVIWIGNFDNTSNNTFIGQETAAPLFFKIVRGLAKYKSITTDDITSNGLNLSQVNICVPTGDIADSYCTQAKSSYFIPGITQIKVSNISRLIPINTKTNKRACRHRPPQTVLKSFEFWPTDVLNAYQSAGISIRKPPAFEEDCPLIETAHIGHPPRILLPAAHSHVLIEERQKIPLKASADSDAKIFFWFVNNRLQGSSLPQEVFQIIPPLGEVHIKVIDDLGRFSSTQIFVRLK